MFWEEGLYKSLSRTLTFVVNVLKGYSLVSVHLKSILNLYLFENRIVMLLFFDFVFY